MNEAEVRASVVEFEQNLAELDLLLKQDPTNAEFLHAKRELEDALHDARKILHDIEVQKRQAILRSQGSGHAAPQAQSQTQRRDVEVGDFVLAQNDAGQWLNAQVTNVRDAEKIAVAFIGTKTKTIVKQVKPFRFPERALLDEPGSPCRAVFAEDGLWYYARVLAANGDDRYRIQFAGYGNEQEVTIHYIEPAEEALVQHAEKKIAPRKPTAAAAAAAAAEPATKKAKLDADGTLPPSERAEAKKQRKHEESELVSRQSTWKQFAAKSATKRTVGFLTTVKHESIFRSPDNIDGKVGVVGSGKGMTSFQDRGRHIASIPIPTGKLSMNDLLAEDNPPTSS